MLHKLYLLKFLFVNVIIRLFAKKKVREKWKIKVRSHNFIILFHVKKIAISF